MTAAAAHPLTKCKQGCDHCFYCDMPLMPRHEHDHFPWPERHGGHHTVGVCLNCHSLKDRSSIRDWDIDDFVRAWKEMGPLGRILLAKTLNEMFDLEKRRQPGEDSR